MRKWAWGGVIRINYNDLGSYYGEKVLLPIISAFVGYHDGKHITCFSPDIIPVFLSFNIIATSLNDEDVAYLKRYAPIGCRDWHTYNTMRKYDIPAYVNGCMTITMEFQEKEKRRGNDIVLVDVPEELEPYIPLEYRKEKKVFSQIRTVKSIDGTEDWVYQCYLEYIRDAKLVITSRLHCAIPCIMAGIPVVFAGGAYDYRFSWLENYIKFYSEDEYDKIDWHPSVNRSLLPVKKEMERFAVERLIYTKRYIEYAFQMSNTVFKKSRDYQIRVFDNLIEAIEQKIQEMIFRGKDIIKFSIWGMSQLSDMIYEYMNARHKECIFAGMFDNKVEDVYKNIPIRKSDEIFHSKIDLIIVIPATIAGEEKEKYKEKLRRSNISYIFGTDCSIVKIIE